MPPKKALADALYALRNISPQDDAYTQTIESGFTAIEAGANPDLRGRSSNNTLLHFIALWENFWNSKERLPKNHQNKKNRLDTIKKDLRARGARTDIPNAKGETVDAITAQIPEASAQNNQLRQKLAALLILKQNDPDYVQTMEECGRLIESGANPDLQAPYRGHTTLHFITDYVFCYDEGSRTPAPEKENINLMIALAKRLIERGARTDIENAFGKTVVSLAKYRISEKEQTGLPSTLLKDLLDAIQSPQTTAPNPETPEPPEDTPANRVLKESLDALFANSSFFWAELYKASHCILDLDADPNLTGPDDNTLLHFIISRLYAETDNGDLTPGDRKKNINMLIDTAAKLIGRGARTDIETAEGSTAKTSLAYLIQSRKKSNNIERPLSQRLLDIMENGTTGAPAAETTAPTFDRPEIG